MCVTLTNNMNYEKIIEEYDKGGPYYVITKRDTPELYKELELEEDGWGNEIFRVLDGWDNDIYLESIEQFIGNCGPDYHTDVKFGCDPELFFMKESKVYPSSFVVRGYNDDDVVEDGFQGELNPDEDCCREEAGKYILYALNSARSLAKGAGAELSFNVGHTIDDELWSKAPTKVKRFGCNATNSVYEPKFKRVTGLRRRFRAAGGHIHVGKLTLRDNPDKAVKLMDIFAGNTAVLLDRDPDNALRRKDYGRAGEYRLKSYGLEYRVLSNFWLRSYTLWSTVSGLIRNAVGVLEHGMADELISRFDMRKVRNAINENDYDLALENFKILCEFVKEKRLTGPGLSIATVDQLSEWVQEQDPISEWRTEKDIFYSWEQNLDKRGLGMERYLAKKYG